MNASPWAGLIPPERKVRAGAPRKIAPKDPIAPRAAKLEQLLQEKGRMTADEIVVALGWAPSQLQPILRRARVRAVDRVRVAAPVLRARAAVQLTPKGTPPCSARLRTAKLIYEVLQARESVPWQELYATLGLNQNTVSNTVRSHPEIFTVVRWQEVVTETVSRVVYAYVGEQP